MAALAFTASSAEKYVSLPIARVFDKIHDTNWWKSYTHAWLAVAMGERGCSSLFGNRSETHRMFAEQVTSEYFVKTEGRGRTEDDWKP